MIKGFSQKNQNNEIHLYPSDIICDRQITVQGLQIYMNTVSSKEGKQVVSLEELVPQHDCLKLLILHTPYTLLIDTLPLCTNLVKLDLSKNNLETFPNLGTLTALRFMFLHENKLDLSQLKNIFELDGRPSQLSQNIVWVTFWGNRSPFLARHYLANSTKAIAVDKHMIVPEERTPNFPYFSCPEAFSPETSIQTFFRRKPNITKHASEQEYMNELWQQLKQLRKKHQSLFPVIKIQKVFRGWILRQTFKRKNQKLEENYQIQSDFFVEWKLYTTKRLKLESILAENGKDYLIFQGREARKKEIIYKMVDWAQRAKARVAARNKTLVNQYRFYKAFKNNFDELNNLYKLLELQSSSCLFISKMSWNLFERIIIPFASNFTKAIIVPQTNSEYVLHCLYDYFSQSTRETLKIYQTNIKSIVFHLKEGEKMEPRTLRRGRKKLTFEISLKSIYRPCHYSTEKMREINQRIKYIDSKDEYSKEELIKVEGDLRLLKDMVRGIYFYNTNRLNIQRQGERIKFLSEGSIKRISSAIKIQKVWRGFIFRKKNQPYLRAILRIQRAAIIIQRWYRRAPSLKRKNFMLKTSKKMAEIQDNILYIDSHRYINLVKQLPQDRQFLFLEQNTKILLNRSTKMISLSWEPKEENLSIAENVRFKKIPFCESFFLKTIGLTLDQLQGKILFKSEECEEAEPAHIFHFETQTSLVLKQGKKYLEIKCSSKSQARFRYILLKLITINLRDKEGISILTSLDFHNYQSKVSIDPAFQQGSFICNQNAKLFDTCQKGLKNNPKKNLHRVANRYYFQKNDKKPMKTEEIFYIFMIQSSDKEKNEDYKKQKKEGAIEKRYKTEVSRTDELNSHFLTDLAENTESEIQISIPQEKFKKVMIKRSMKQFKIDKRLKQRKPQQPNFVLDSISINDRLTTQPEVYATQPSLREPHLQDKIMNSKGNIISNHKVESADIRKSMSQDRKQPKSNYESKRAQSLKRQQDDSFIRKFVNMGNFIQNQFANDHHRREKMKSEHSVVESAENIRRSMQRSHSQRVAKIQQKLKDVRDKHIQHLELIKKNEQTSKEHADRLKSQVSEEKQKRVKEKSRLKRLKVSFAEECYPLGNRNRPQEYFA